MSQVLKNFSDELATLVEKAGASVVHIDARTRFPATGIVWSADGVIVTANHVVQDDEEIKVILPDGETVSAELVGRDPTSDIAVLRVEAEGLTVPEWVDSSDLTVGQIAFALGRPGEGVQAVMGMISALEFAPAGIHKARERHAEHRRHAGHMKHEEHEEVIHDEHGHTHDHAHPRGRGRFDVRVESRHGRRHIRKEIRRGPPRRFPGRPPGPPHRRVHFKVGGRPPFMRGLRGGRFIRPDIVMYPGFSGGPLLDASGKFVGMNTSVLFRGGPITIPAKTINSVVETLLTHGRMRKGYLGLSAQPARITGAVAEELGQSVGLLITSIEADSPAEKGGLLVGDIVTSVDDIPVDSFQELFPILSGDRVGQEIPVKIVRGGALSSVSVIIGERP